jgi:hypothetical protein
MEFDKLRVLRFEDKSSILDFEAQKAASNENPLAFMDNWSAPWREESLDHYLGLGWCMGFFEGDQIQGYVLVQPVLFFRGLTQSLWIESVRGATSEIFSTLFEAIIRVSKEKHLQQVFFHQTLFQDFESQANAFKIESLSEFSFVKTTRWQN